MEIKSPIGELPFEVTSTAVGRHGLELHGSMGAWPTEVKMTWADLAGTARTTLRPLAPHLATAAITVVAAATLTKVLHRKHA